MASRISKRWSALLACFALVSPIARAQTPKPHIIHIGEKLIRVFCDQILLYIGDGLTRTLSISLSLSLSVYT